MLWCLSDRIYYLYPLTAKRENINVFYVKQLLMYDNTYICRKSVDNFLFIFNFVMS